MGGEEELQTVFEDGGRESLLPESWRQRHSWAAQAECTRRKSLLRWRAASAPSAPRLLPVGTPLHAFALACRSCCGVHPDASAWQNSGRAVRGTPTSRPPAAGLQHPSHRVGRVSLERGLLPLPLFVLHTLSRARGRRSVNSTHACADPAVSWHTGLMQRCCC